MPTDYIYLPERDDLLANISELLTSADRDLWKLIRAELQTVEAVAALRVLEHRHSTPDILNYAEYLRSDRWKAKRAAKLESHPACEKCGATHNLHVHHLTYRNVGHETPADLQTLCAECHAGAHGK